MPWYTGWGFDYFSPDGDVNKATQTRPTQPQSEGKWYQGWGFWYQSPDGDVNHATATSPVNPNAPATNPQTPPPSPPTTTPVPGQPFIPSPDYTPEQRSAKAELMQTLGNYGLASLADFAWTEYLNNIPIDQIMLDIRQTDQYKQRFPAMATLASKGQAITEGQYINYETSAASLFQAAGLPPGFYDQPDDFTNFLTKGVALPELQSRIDVAKQAVYNSDPATLAALSDYYGVNGGTDHIGDATAYFLDPDRALPAIQKQMIAAQEAGSAVRAGYNGLLQTDAERLATLGIDPQQAQKGFGTLANLDPLFTNLPGEAGATPTREQGLQSVFEDNADATNAIEAQANKRKAVFQEGGSFSQTSGGMTGI